MSYAGPQFSFAGSAQGGFASSGLDFGAASGNGANFGGAAGEQPVEVVFASANGAPQAAGPSGAASAASGAAAGGPGFQTIYLEPGPNGQYVIRQPPGSAQDNNQALSQSAASQRRSQANLSSHLRGPSTHSFSGAHSRNFSQNSAHHVPSQLEQAVIEAREPIETNETEKITVGPFHGTFLNKREVEQFRGPVPVEQYPINEDHNPEVIHKRLEKVKYKQEVCVRYLNPPPGPKPGDIIVREKQSGAPPAPPVIIRQEPCGNEDPEPLVFREHPPPPPPCIPETVVELEGPPAPPPARRVIVEKLDALPPKPQNMVIEKWLPFRHQKRRVIYQGPGSQFAANVRNVVIEWEAQGADVEQVCCNLGVQDQDPHEYVRRYGPELKHASELPKLCGVADFECKTGRGSGASSAGSSLPELEGDIEALRRVDLDKYGLGEYRRYLH